MAVMLGKPIFLVGSINADDTQTVFSLSVISVPGQGLLEVTVRRSLLSFLDGFGDM